ncbi:MAG: PaeR7I family type II restriction endonuclease [Coriobacteriales bacterium]|jgi:hypothetical protein|nr:PaeR7I family type II restriction endonuclease [Coriobacteriales bacterium]
MKKIEYALLEITRTRKAAATKQAAAGAIDKGARGEVTSGGHLNAVAKVIANVFIDAGIPADWIFCSRNSLELPGYFRAEKKWDIIIAHDSKLIAAIELKSIWGSYSKNLNNRAEEAIGSAIDIARAIRSGLLGSSSPWLGYVFILKDNEIIRKTTRFKEPHFLVDGIFKETNYLERFEIMCSRLVAERLYNNAWYVCLKESGEFFEPNPEMTWNKFEAAIKGKVLEVLA